MLWALPIHIAGNDGYKVGGCKERYETKTNVMPTNFMPTNFRPTAGGYKVGGHKVGGHKVR